MKETGSGHNPKEKKGVLFSADSDKGCHWIINKVLIFNIQIQKYFSV
jgi:hypothetical protein